MASGAAGGMFGLRATPRGERPKPKQLQRMHSTASVGSRASRGSRSSRTSIYERDADWKERREARAREAKKARADKEMQECTFSPSTNRAKPTSGRRIVAQVKIKLRAAAYTAGGVDFARLFKHYDRDNSGSLDFEEFRSAIRRDAKVPKREVSDTELKQVFGTVDIDGGGEIDIDEFVAWINAEDPQDDTPALDTPPKRRRRKRPTEGQSPATPGDGTNGAGGAGGASAAGWTVQDDPASTMGGSPRPAPPPVPPAQAPVRPTIGIGGSSAKKKPLTTTNVVRSKKQVPDTPLIKQVKIKLKAAAYTSKGMDFGKLFGYYDRDNSGSLEFPEFVSAIRRDAKIPSTEVPDEALQEIFDAVDDDGGGEVDIDEFVAWLNSSTTGKVITKKKRKKRRKRGTSRSRSRSRARPVSPPTPLSDTPTRLMSFKELEQRGASAKGAAAADVPEETPLVRKVKSKLRAAAYTSGGVNFAKLFKHYDRDNSGSLEFDEFRSALRRDAKIRADDVSDLELREVFRTVDADGGGEVEIDEFVAWLGSTGIPAPTARRRSPTKKSKLRRKVKPTPSPSPGRRTKRSVAVSPPPAPLQPKGAGSSGVASTPHKRRKDTPLVKAVKMKLRAAAYTSKGMDFAKLFKHYDRDNSGSLDFNEFRSALRRDAKITANQVSDNELKRVFDSVDDDGGGEVEIDEFVEWLGLNTSASKPKPKRSHNVPAPAPAPAPAPVRKPKKRKKQRTDTPLVKAVKIKLRAAAYTSKGMDFAKLFKHYDRDNSGSLDFSEFRSAIRRDAKITANQVSDNELKRVFDSVDDDGGGEVEIDEFVEWLGLTAPKDSGKPKPKHKHKHKHKHRSRGDDDDGTGAAIGDADADGTADDAAQAHGGVDVDEEEALLAAQRAASQSEAAKLAAARAALWDDVLELPDGLLDHVDSSHDLNQQLLQVKKRIADRNADARDSHGAGAGAGSANDAGDDNVSDDGAVDAAAGVDRGAASHASSRKRGQDRGRPRHRSGRSGRSSSQRSASAGSRDGDASIASSGVAAGDHLAFLETQYAALFGQDGKVTTLLRGSSDVVPAVAAGARGAAPSDRASSDGGDMDVDAASESLVQPLADLQAMARIPEEGTAGSGAVSPSGRALIGSPGARTSRGGSDGGFAPDNSSDRGADAAHVVSVRREISRVKQEHQASIVEMAARHQAELEAATTAPSATQSAEFRALMDRFVHSEEERSRLLVSLSAAQRHLAHLQQQHADTQARNLQLQASLASGGVNPPPAFSAEDMAAAQEQVVRARVEKETAEVKGQLQAVLTDNGLLQARLAAAEAALKAVDLQRHDLTAERSAWLDQLQQENVSLRGVYEEAKQAKERLVEEMNELAKQREALDEERLALLESAAVAAAQSQEQQQQQQKQLAIADGPDRDDGDGRDGEGGSAESRPSLAAEAPPGARRVTVDGIVVEVRNAAGLPTALSDQGAVELLARHQVEAFKEKSRANKAAASQAAAEAKAQEAVAEAEAARAEVSAVRKTLAHVREKHDTQLRELEERLSSQIKAVESKNRLLHTSMDVLKNNNRQLKLKNAALQMRLTVA